MADPTPIEAALEAYDKRTRHFDLRAYPELVTEGIHDALAAAIGAVDLVQVLAEARHPHLWTGRFAELLRKMPKTFPTEDLVQASVQKKQAEALTWATVEAAAVRAALGVTPACPICGSTKPGGTPSCDCDAHRDVPTTETTTKTEETATDD